MFEIPTGEEVLAGTFSLNKSPIIILFDSGASHDFMSSTYAKKAKLSLVVSGTPYVISTPGGRVDADRIVRKGPLDLARWVIEIDLIILSGQGIDELDEMAQGHTRHKIPACSPKLTCAYGMVTLYFLAASRIKASLHHVVEMKFEDILVV
jgi:hypothetical protein